MKAVFAFAAIAVLAVPAASAPVRHRGVPVHHTVSAARDWTQVVVATPQGGFRMGNPNARVKLVEYGSLSCPYCKSFDQEGVPILRDKYVKSGKVSWEYRTYLNHPTDPAVSVLVHCQGPAKFFATADQLYATQEQWYGRLVAARAQYEKLLNLPVTTRNAEIARITGLDRFFEQRGMPSSKVRACLADKARLDQLAAIVQLANRDGLTGTPNFLINGKLVADVGDWKALEPLIRTAAGG